MIAVVTGASAGVGRAVARELAKRGASIGLVARGRDGLEGARRDVERLGGRAVIAPADVADVIALRTHGVMLLEEQPCTSTVCGFVFGSATMRSPIPLLTQVAPSRDTSTV